VSAPASPGERVALGDLGVAREPPEDPLAVAARFVVDADVGRERRALAADVVDDVARAWAPMPLDRRSANGERMPVALGVRRCSLSFSTAAQPLLVDTQVRSLSATCPSVEWAPPARPPGVVVATLPSAVAVRGSVIVSG